MSDGGVDRISALPEGVLQHIVGFLPAQDAVRTCLLGRPWRHVWEHTLCLYIRNIYEIDGVNDAHCFSKFVNGLLLLRDPKSALDEVIFDFDPYMHGGYIDFWIRHALLCQARVVAVKLNPHGAEQLKLDYRPLVSQYLRRLELADVEMEMDTLDFASCPVLEDLEIRDCTICTGRIISQSVKRISMVDTGFFHDSRTRISVPNLVWLQLDRFGGKAPLLEIMPSLQTAFVKCYSQLGEDYYCSKGDFMDCCGNCAECCGDDDHNTGCLLLDGLSSATNLELTAEFGVLVFSRDLRWCPTFHKLKTMLLNGWCVIMDLCQLVCILEHSPVLEKLTLQLCRRPEFTIESEESYHPMGKLPAISEHLSIVEIRCEVVDERVSQVLKFLDRFTMQVNIIRSRTKSTFFSFEKW